MLLFLVLVARELCDHIRTHTGPVQAASPSPLQPRTEYRPTQLKSMGEPIKYSVLILISVVCLGELLERGRRHRLALAARRVATELDAEHWGPRLLGRIK